MTAGPVLSVEGPHLPVRVTVAGDHAAGCDGLDGGEVPAVRTTSISVTFSSR